MLEFYDENGSCIASVKSSIVPPVARLINIRKKTYVVVRVTYALDHADEPQDKCLRANIDLAPMEEV